MASPECPSLHTAGTVTHIDSDSAFSAPFPNTRKRMCPGQLGSGALTKKNVLPSEIDCLLAVAMLLKRSHMMQS